MSEPESIFEALPGMQMPVAQVMDTLSSMWHVPFEVGNQPATDFRSSQMNLVLHFGLKTTPSEAIHVFNMAIAFAQKYPCRIIVLCPRGREVSDELLEAKLFSQCYIGDILRDMCCCEALMLGYPTRVAGFLEDQVSLWLENDLPIYHWFYKVPAKHVADIYMGFIRRCRRAIYDASIEEDDYSAIPWERPQAIRDLAYARLLPVRQSLGQFLSSFQPGSLVEGLRTIHICYADEFCGEAHCLKKWFESCLESCAEQSKTRFEGKFQLSVGCPQINHSLKVDWEFENKERSFKWFLCKDTGSSHIEANLGFGRTELALQIELLNDEKVLAEALFNA